MSKCRTCIAAVQHYLTHYASILHTRLLRLVPASFRCWGFFFLALEQAAVQSDLTTKEKTSAWGQKQAEVLVPVGHKEGMREEALGKTPSQRLSLAAKPNDNISVIVLRRDSVTFSTGRYGFDINHIAVMLP